LDYEFNEAWILSDAGDITPETTGGKIKAFSESYPNGKIRSKWSARICTNGRYLLNGEETDYYENGAKQHEVVYENGRKKGDETFWTPDGTKVWTWYRDLKTNRGIWTHYWPNGKKKYESTWNLRPEARDLKRQFYGYVAEGPAQHWDEQGKLIASYEFVKGDLQGTSGVNVTPKEGD
jgi:antitoxin component YwqK of YwqJK toxin-antitoxin module